MSSKNTFFVTMQILIMSCNSTLVASASSGAVDEDIFVRQFEQVPKVTVSITSNVLFLFVSAIFL